MNLSKLNRILLQTLLLPVVALMFVSGLLVWQILSAQRTVARIEIADQNIANANLIIALIGDEETGVRGYQNTANEIFLQPYEFAAVPLDNTLHKLRVGIASQNGDQRKVDELIAAHQHWINSIAEPMIDMVRNGGYTRDPGLNLRGKANIDHVREIIAGIIDTQHQLRTVAAERWQKQVRHTLEAVIGLSLIAGIIIGLFARSRLHLVSAAFEEKVEALRANTMATFESEQRLRATLTSIADGVIVCDLEGHVELLNTVAQQITGWPLDEALHQSIDKVFPLIDANTHTPLDTPFTLVKRLNQVASLSVHTLLLRRDGSEIYVDSSGAPIYDREGALSGVVMVFRDVTDQLRTQNALIASEKLAVAGRLTATIAHEIHNPLDSVVNLLYLMKSGATKEESTQYLELASVELDRVTQISRAMLGMYRESRTPVPLEIQPILESVLVLLDRQRLNAGVTIQTDIDPDAIVTGYPAELRQVFTNLLANATEASVSGGTIEVVVRNQPARRGKTSTPAGVTVAVIDHGIGITKENLEHLFQPFFTTKGEHGTGLGLWVSLGIIQKHGGTITVDTRTDPTDHGSTITVFLPRGDSPAPPAQA